MTITLYDTTLRDGTQGEGLAFSVDDKLKVARKLDEFGLNLVESITPERMLTEFRETGSADFGYAHGTRARFRVAIFRQRGQAALVARLIPSRLLTFDEIGLPPAVQALC